MIEIDGNHLEGGGQILRTAIALSAITSKAVTIGDIRKGREKPGLKPQHFEGIVAAAKISNAEVDGLAMNSTRISFVPGKIRGGTYTVDTRTAGSVTLILQCLIPIAIFSDAPVELAIKGGTAVPYSPTTEYFVNIFCQMVEKFGISIVVKTRCHGFYPRGGGRVEVRIEPATLHNVVIHDRGPLEMVDVMAIASEHLRETRVAERMVEGFRMVLPKSRCQTQYIDVPSPGCFIRSFARFRNSIIGSDGVGKKGKRAEAVGQETAQTLKREMKTMAVIDRWMVDQVVPYMALATAHSGEESSIRISGLSKHAQTNIWVVGQFLPVRFQCENNILRCVGAGD